VSCIVALLLPGRLRPLAGESRARRSAQNKRPSGFCTLEGLIAAVGLAYG